MDNEFKPPVGTPTSTPAGDYIKQSNDYEPTYFPKTKSVKWEDSYKRGTFYIHKDQMRELDFRAGNEKGKKTKIINEALQYYFRNVKHYE